jgi:hypothetical protein
MGLWFVLLAALPIIYNLYNSNNSYLPIIPMQSSMLQTVFFILFMLSMYCTASMLPCGRYYYAPEGGYVGNPWVKFSYQYAYLYLAWFLHHLDLVEHYGFQYAHHLLRRQSSIKKMSHLRFSSFPASSFNQKKKSAVRKLTYNYAYM